MNAFIRGVGQSVGATEVEGRLTALLAAGALGLMIVGVAGFVHIHVVHRNSHGMRVLYVTVRGLSRGHDGPPRGAFASGLCV
ncbi:MAG: CbtB-domain containing protein, partial [Pseudomonadota bacterium]|nr:CbtB-domain containing protein [Pseudomonadota bacterium]